MGSRNIVNEVAGGFATTTRNVANINGANMSAVLSDTRANHDTITAINPGLKKVIEAKGASGKVKAFGESLKDGVKENIELDRQYREHVQSQEAYRELLEEMREDRQAVINGTKYGRGKLNRPYSEEVQVIIPNATPKVVGID